MEPESIPMSNLSLISSDGVSVPRQATLESQRGLQKRRTAFNRLLRGGNDEEDAVEDTVELFLQTTTPTPEPAIVTGLQRMLQEYRSIKGRPVHKIRSNVFRYWVFNPHWVRRRTQEGEDSTPLSVKQDDLALEESDSFSTFTNKLFNALRSPSPDDVRIVGVALLPDREAINGVFSFSHETWSTFRGRLRTLHLVPSRVISFLTWTTWGLPESTLASIFTEQDVRNSNPVKVVRPPWSVYSHGNLDPLQPNHNQFSLTWQFECPEFESDMQVYIWQYYRDPPPVEYVDVFLQPGDKLKNSETTFFALFRSSHSLECFDKSRHADSTHQDSSLARDECSWSAKTELIFSIRSIFDVMTMETLHFLQNGHNQLHKLKWEGRREPSSSKIRFLIHMADRVESAFHGIVHGLEVLILVSSWIGEIQSGPNPREEEGRTDDQMARLRGDLEFCKSELSQLGVQIENLQQFIREQLILTQDRRNWILALVAALYLPLSFATSLLGMNIEPTTSPGPKGFSNYTAAWLDGLPSDLGNSTKAIVSTIGTSGSFTWTWTTFAIISICLVATTPLSLAIGGIVRGAIQSATIYAPYWRALFLLGAAIFFLFTTFGNMFVQYDELWLEGIIIQEVLNFFLVVFDIWRILVSLRRKRNRLFWIIALYLTSATAVLNLFVPFVPWMLLTWLWFGWRYVRHRWKQWREKKQSKRKQP